MFIKAFDNNLVNTDHISYITYRRETLNEEFRQVVAFMAHPDGCMIKLMEAESEESAISYVEELYKLLWAVLNHGEDISNGGNQ